MRLSALMLLALAPPAFAVPLQLTHTGRLADATGAPVTGAHTLDVTLHASAGGVDPVWSKSGISANFSEGYFSIALGDDGSLDAETLAGGEVWIELALDGGAPMSPRHPLRSVPYAILAHSVSGGAVDASSLAVDGAAVVDSEGALALPLPWALITGVPADVSDGDADSLAGITCADGQVLKWQAGAPACGDDTDTNTQLDEAAVDGFVANNGYAVSDELAAVATSGAYADLSGRPTTLPPSGAAGGDLAGNYPNPTVGAGKITANHLAADNAGLAKVSGGALAVSGSGAGQTTTVTGQLAVGTVVGPHGYATFFTDRVKNDSTTANQSYTLLDMRCSGHWGSYYAEIELITYYYRPSVRRYEFFCGNGNHTSGGTLREVSATQVTGQLATLSLGNVRDTGLDHSGIRMYDSKLTVTQPAYVESYAKVTVYGQWPSYRAGTAFSTTSPSAVWATWTK